MRVAELLFNRPLMITEHKLNTILHAMGPRFNLDAGSLPVIEARPVTEDERMRSGYWVQDAAAVIEVCGPLMHRLMASDYPSGGPTTYSEIWRAFDVAMDDDAVKRVVLFLHSPGGEVHGVFDLADHIFQARGKKPVTALLDEMACSACYLLAAAAGEIIIPRTGTAGSIGVIATHADFSRWEDDNGIKVTHVFAGAHKADYSQHQPLSDDALSRLQSSVDYTYDLFVSAVAKYRGMSKDAVRKTEALTYEGQAAVDAGLADGVMPINKAFAKLVKGGSTMSLFRKKAIDPAPAQAAEETPVTYTQDQLDAAVAEATAEMVPVAEANETAETAIQQAVTEAATKAVETERTRVSALLEVCQSQNSMAMFGGMVQDGCSADDAGKRIHDVKVAQDENLDITSRHAGGGQKAKTAIDHQSALKNT
jgi:signal peptide peptidase SppA